MSDPFKQIPEWAACDAAHDAFQAAPSPETWAAYSAAQVAWHNATAILVGPEAVENAQQMRTERETWALGLAPNIDD